MTQRTMTRASGRKTRTGIRALQIAVCLVIPATLTDPVNADPLPHHALRGVERPWTKMKTPLPATGQHTHGPARWAQPAPGQARAHLPDRYGFPRRIPNTALPFGRRDVARWMALDRVCLETGLGWTATRGHAPAVAWDDCNLYPMASDSLHEWRKRNRYAPWTTYWKKHPRFPATHGAASAMDPAPDDHRHRSRLIPTR